MIICLDLSGKKHSLGWYEFVAPIMEIIHKEGVACISVHYSDFSMDDDPDIMGVIMCGTPLCDNSFSLNSNSFQWLLSCDIPVLGICAGFQALSLAFGGHLEEKTEIGMVSIRSTGRNDFIDTCEYEAYELHKYAPSPGDGFTILAESDRCIQAVKHQSRPFYGVMFHPEVRNEWVVKNFLSICGLASSNKSG